MTQLISLSVQPRLPMSCVVATFTIEVSISSSSEQVMTVIVMIVRRHPNSNVEF
jgi:hypothetical protein